MVSLGWAGFDPAPCRDSRWLPPRSLTTFGTGFAHPNEATNSIRTLSSTTAPGAMRQSNPTTAPDSHPEASVPFATTFGRGSPDDLSGGGGSSSTLGGGKLGYR